MLAAPYDLGPAVVNAALVRFTLETLLAISTGPGRQRFEAEMRGGQ